jgi:RNA polymerase sigma-70 factor (ECF subfamily)
MQQAMSVFVLNSKAAKPVDMDEESRNCDSEQPTADRSDEQLMLSYCGGHSEASGIAAFNELFSRYKQPLFGFFRRRLADPAQAEELTQETFIVILRSSGRYEPTALFRTYLYSIGFTILRSHRRKLAFRALFQSTADTTREPAMHTSIDADIQIRQAVGRLEHIDREVLMLREFEQLSYAEIAQVLGLPVNTVRTRLFRARTALREILSAPAARLSAATLAEGATRVELKERS